MNVIGINAGPRKKWNTHTLIENALEGARSQGAQTEMIHLFDLDFTGCVSCFACKLIDGKSYGTCAVQDDLKEVLKKIEEADAVVLGSPIYFGEVTAEFRGLLERLFFQYLVYDKERTLLNPKRKPVLLIFTTNAPEVAYEQVGYLKKFDDYKGMFGRFIGETNYMYASETLQFKDYSKYMSTMMDPAAREKRHDEIFPMDCKRAYSMGSALLNKQE
ncbi:flavodoxin family protein [Alkalibacter rhizosphaerae]|uniref:Flavodoxin family protein n=1 Tax=Alkalibacter rhizosphaerae TaxID=2815577 RepID=A0A974XE16_9FIRM|nr:flavodoxin family protein [Alkalibacter rhizosphaerae]QSX08113.1 flavodoxin family protein [Alkalibacter rhizosphaerae]